MTGHAPSQAPCAVLAAFENPRPFNAGGHARVDLPVPVSACPGCEGQGFRRATFENGYVYVRDCEGKAALRRAELYNRSGLPGRYAESSLELFQPHPVSVGAARAVALEFVRAWPAAKAGVVFVGRPGVGKTHLLAGIVRSLTLDKGVPCRYVDFTHLVNDLRAAIGRRSSPAEIVRPLVEVDLLAVDDLGRGLLETDYEASVIDELVSRRYNADRVTLFATNFPDDPATEPSASRRRETNLSERDVRPRPLAEVVGERVVSRIRQMCRFVEIEAEDFRATAGPRPLRGRPRPARG